MPIVDRPRGEYVDRVGLLGTRRAPPDVGVGAKQDAAFPPSAFRLPPSSPLPMTRAEMDARGWGQVDIVFVTGDAYVDHPSFAMALLGRLLEDEGFRVAILSQPDWHSCEPWRTFGKPRLFFAVSTATWIR